MSSRHYTGLPVGRSVGRAIDQGMAVLNYFRKPLSLSSVSIDAAPFFGRTSCSHLGQNGVDDAAAASGIHLKGDLLLYAICGGAASC